MTEKWNIIRLRCTTCDGTGIFPSQTAGVCPNCDGSGYTDSRLEVDITDIVNKIKDIKKTVDDIWDKIK